MVVGDAHVFPGFLTPVLTQLFFPKPPTTFLTCFCRGERRRKESSPQQCCIDGSSTGDTSTPDGSKGDTSTPDGSAGDTSIRDDSTCDTSIGNGSFCDTSIADGDRTPTTR